MECDDIIQMTINNARAAIVNAKIAMEECGEEHAAWEVYVQIVKDNENFIAEQQHTLSLINDGDSFPAQNVDTILNPPPTSKMI